MPREHAFEHLPRVQCWTKVSAFEQLVLRQSRPVRQNTPPAHCTTKQEGRPARSVVCTAVSIGVHRPTKLSTFSSLALINILLTPISKEDIQLHIRLPIKLKEDIHILLIQLEIIKQDILLTIRLRIKRKEDIRLPIKLKEDIQLTHRRLAHILLKLEEDIRLPIKQMQQEHILLTLEEDILMIIKQMIRVVILPLLKEDIHLLRLRIIRLHTLLVLRQIIRSNRTIKTRIRINRITQQQEVLVQLPK